MEISYLLASFIEGGVRRGLSSYCGWVLYCYKPFEVNQSLGFYQFTARGKDYKLIKSLVTSDRNWKTEFFFVSGFWAGRPIEVDKDSFPPYTGELGNLRPEGMLVLTLSFIVFILICSCLKVLTLDPLSLFLL